MVADARREDVRLLADVVRRLRRVAEHPLAKQDGGKFLKQLYTVETKAEVRSDGTATLRNPLPDEVQFESLATRVRVFMLSGDRLYFGKLFDALDRMTVGDERAQEVNQNVRDGWSTATDRTSRTRAYRIIQQDMASGSQAEQAHDVDLAFAWLYQDVAHGDEPSTGGIGIMHRYQAAVGVFSHVAVMALHTLVYIKQLIEAGVIQLPEAAFKDQVIVTDTEVVIEGKMYESEVGADLGDFELGGPVPQHFRPAFDAIHQIVQSQERDES